MDWSMCGSSGSSKRTKAYIAPRGVCSEMPGILLSPLAMISER